MKKYLSVLTAFTVSLITVTAQVPDKAMYVAIKKADVKASAGFFAPVRGTLDLGSQVMAVQARGKWTEIRPVTPALSGWVASAAPTGRKISSAGYIPRAGEMAMAGKGFLDEIEQIYREGEKLDYSPVDAMESFAVPEQELYAFLADGYLAKGE
jgi:hypothetical protein